MKGMTIKQRIDYINALANEQVVKLNPETNQVIILLQDFQSIDDIQNFVEEKYFNENEIMPIHPAFFGNKNKIVLPDDGGTIYKK